MTVTYANPPTRCDIGGEEIKNRFIDGRLAGGGQWGFFCPACWKAYGVGKFGTGLGQEFTKRADGKFEKTAG